MSIRLQSSYHAQLHLNWKHYFSHSLSLSHWLSANDESQISLHIQLTTHSLAHSGMSVESKTEKKIYLSAIIHRDRTERRVHTTHRREPSTVT